MSSWPLVIAALAVSSCVWLGAKWKWRQILKEDALNRIPDNMVKVTFNLPITELEALKSIATRRGRYVTTTLRAAIATELFLDQEEAKGSLVLLLEPSGRYTRVIRR